MKRIRHAWVIWYVITIHFLWAGLLLYSPGVAGVTAIFHTAHWLSRSGAAIVFGAVATLACIGLLRRGTSSFDILMLIPQQVVLMLSAMGACVAIYQSHFADGVVRPREFIAADQGQVIAIALAHTGAIWDCILSAVLAARDHDDSAA